MHTRNRYAVRLELIEHVTNFIIHVFGTAPLNEEQCSLLHIIGTYRKDTVRLRDGQRGTAEHALQLKEAVRSAGEMINEIAQEDDGSLEGWYFGAETRNLTQATYGLLVETALELSLSILEIESHYPAATDVFQAEREAYHL
jgi:hypothetical protein